MTLSRRLAGARSDAARRLAGNAWLILQAAIAATAAWIVASRVVDHRQPFFAPIAAVASLNAARGERGPNAVRMVLGVLLGILVGEAAVAVGGDGYASLGGATLVAMIAALAISGERLVVGQAAIAAILTVALPHPGAGPDLLFDALIGVGIALTLSQLIFPPEPDVLVRGAEAAALRTLADGLRLTAAALEQGDEALAARARSFLREAPGRLVALTQARTSSSRVVRWSPIRRRGRRRVRDDHAAHLYLLAGSCLMLTRAVLELDRPATDLVTAIRDLAACLDLAADALGDPEARRRAVEIVLALARRDPGREASRSSELDLAWAALRTTARDVIVVAGVDRAQANRAV